MLYKELDYLSENVTLQMYTVLKTSPENTMRCGVFLAVSEISGTGLDGWNHPDKTHKYGRGLVTVLGFEAVEYMVDNSRCTS